MEKCRACLATDGAMLPIDDEFVYNYNILTSLDIKISDELNQYVCETCLQSVKFFIAFRNKCVLSESILKNELELKVESNTSQSKNVGDIKIEYELQFDDPFLDAVDCNEDISYNFKNEDTEDIKPRKPIIKKCGRKKKCKEKSIKECSSQFLSCGLCPQNFESKKDLSDHVEIHKETVPIECVICSAKLTTWMRALVHRAQHLPMKQFYCHLCSKRFHSPDYMEFHYRKDHFGEKDFLFPCGFCDHTFKTPMRLSKHMCALHSNKSFICDYCGKKCKTKQAIRLHIYHHLGLKTFRCDKCDFSCNFSFGLKDHQARKHMRKRLDCDNCKRAFINQAERDRHRCKLKQVRVCPVCGVQLKAHVRLARHMETHTEVGRYKCPICPKTLKSRHALKAHTDRHDGTPSNNCSYCPAKFYSASSLIKHIRIHTGEKPYICTICSKAFTSNYNLKVHMKVHGLQLVNKKDKTLELEQTQDN